MNNKIDSVEYRGFTIDTYQDDQPDDPRNWDNLGTMVCWHRNYLLGDHCKSPDGRTIHGKRMGNSELVAGFRDPDEFTEWYSQNKNEVCVILPLVLLDHSGLWMGTESFIEDVGGWDSSNVGYIFVTKEQVRNEFNCKRINRKLIERVRGILQCEVETYSKYISGEVYGFMIDGMDDACAMGICDGCWGFYDYDDMIVSAKESIDAYITEVRRRRIEKVKAWIKNHVPIEYRTPFNDLPKEAQRPV